MTTKPLVLRLREAKESIVAAVNAAIKEQGLPCYLLEPIAEMYNQVKATALREYEIAKQQVSETPTEAGGEDDGQRA